MANFFVQDIPLISNLGSEFQLKPINFFTELASLDVIDSNDFAACAPKQGSAMFDYTWTGQGDNPAFNESAFTIARPLHQPSDTPVPTAPMDGLANFKILETLQDLGNLG